MSVTDQKTARDLPSNERRTFKVLFRRKINQPQQRDLIILFGVSLIFRLATAAWASQPWYPDAAYYFDVAKNLATGHGFTEDFIFIYLTPTKSVVHPSNFYWMPLTSIIIAPFLALFGTSWRIAQIPITLLSTFLPLFTYWIGWDIFQSRRYALAMALFTLIGGYTYPFYLAATDSMALYAWVSLLAFVGMYQGWRGHPWRFALTGIAIGLAHLTRVDGLLLLPIGGLIWLCSQKKKNRKGNPFWKSSESTQLHPIPWQALLGMVCFYLLTMAPWFLRNIALIGSPLPTGGAATIWLTNYADFFSFHKDISPQAYLNWGWSNILSSKVETLADHFLLLNGVIYIPFSIAMLGMWIERKQAELLPPLLYLITIYSTLSLIFTFPSTYGTFFHSLVPMIPFLYAWALSGIDTILAYLSKRFGKRHGHTKKTTGTFPFLRVKDLAIFSRTTVPKQDTGSSSVFSKFPLKDLIITHIFWDVFTNHGSKPSCIEETRHDLCFGVPLYRRLQKLVGNDKLKDGGMVWLVIAMVIAIIAVGKTALTTSAVSGDYILYQQVGKIVASDYKENGILHNSVQPVVMVADSADYYYATGQHAVLLPAQPLSAVLDTAQSYSVSYILSTPNQGKEEQQIWKRTLTNSRLKLLWSSPSGKLYRFHDPSKVTTD